MLYFSYNILSLFFFITICFFIEVMGGVVDLVLLELYLSIHYFICLGWAVLKFNKYPLFLLMFTVFGLFIYSRFILDSFGLLPYEINLATRFVGNLFPFLLFVFLKVKRKFIIAYFLKKLVFI